MINRIKIKGYKSIKDLSLALEPLNILIGSNGVGKSNFISFFKLINTLYEQRLENFSLVNGADNLLWFGRKNTTSIKGRLDFDKTNAYEFLLNSTNDNKLFINAEWTYFNKKIYGKDEWIATKINANSKEAKIKDEQSAISKYVRTHLESFLIYHFHDTSVNAPLRAKAKLDDNRYLKENGSNLASYLYYLQQKHGPNFKRIEKTVASVAPFFERFQLAPSRLAEDEIKLEWTEKGRPEAYFDASHLSDGTIRFIALATLLLQPELPKTILIDEPELGLHPVAINKLAAMLKSAAAKGCQVILSTQSVNLVNNFEPEDIITVDRDGDQSSFNRLNVEELKNWLTDYSLGELWTKSIIKGQP